MLHIQIESLRRKMGWSQAELAKRLHISPSSVGMYEQGRREPSIDILAALAEMRIYMNVFTQQIEFLCMSESDALV